MLQLRTDKQQIQYVLADIAVLFGLGLANVHLLHGWPMPRRYTRCR